MTDTDRHVGSELRAPTASELWRVALALPGWEASACATVSRRLSELCAVRAEVSVAGPKRLAASTTRTPDDMVVTLATREGGVSCAWLELEGSLARALVDLALGGTADTAELAHVESLDATRTGVLLYMAATALGTVPQEALRIVDLRHACEVPRPERLSCSARVTLQGRVYGAQLCVDVAALPSFPTTPIGLPVDTGRLPDWAREATCWVSLELARGALDGESLASLEPGDVVIPDEVSAEPGAWELAVLRCDLFADPLAMARVGEQGLTLTDPRPRVGPALAATLTPFTIEATRVRAHVTDVLRWLAEGRLPLDVDPHAPLTLWSAEHALARGRLVRDRSEVGLCIESVRRPEPDTRPY